MTAHRLQTRPSDAPSAELALQRAFEHFRAGRLREAENAVHAALEANPRKAAAVCLLGLIAQRTGHLDAALQLMQQAAEIEPGNAALHVNLCSVLLALARHAEAEASARRAIALKPHGPEAHNNLGLALKGMGKAEHAVAHFEKALHYRPDFAEAHNNLGNALMDTDAKERALGAFERAVALRPAFPEAWNGLGTAMRDLGQIATAVSAFREAIRLDPGFADANFNLAYALKETGNIDEALTCFRRATRKKPELAAVNPDRSLAHLVSGRLKEGWLEYEWRGAMRSLGPFTEMIWKGESILDKTILVWSEQGIGDQILFASCFPDIVRIAGHCIIECDQRLVPLFQRSFPETTVHGEQRFNGKPVIEWKDFSWLERLPKIDRFVLAGSLPRYFRNSYDAFPKDGRFLVADAARTAAWRSRLEALGPGPKVGVSWRSINVEGIRKSEHPPIESWEPLLRLPGVRFVSLQAAATAEEFQYFHETFGCTIDVFDELDLLNDLDGTAAFMDALDGVVATQTNTAELAGSLGLPTWRVARSERHKDWTCLGHPDGRPWFPGMRALFGIETDVLTAAFAAIARELPEKIRRPV